MKSQRTFSNKARAQHFASLKQVEKTAERLSGLPEFGARFESADAELQGLRYCLVSGFDKYIVIYRVCSDDIVIMRVVDSRRHLPKVLKD